ncbi:related to regulatory protein cys-3 [Rhynchosporium graminicola]|uniref:Related to regulatory protein cys-3 n=1 Tax=Rhynchosporium graminicola TaxID=2792576 RepID=A0A1E1KIR5_9HELO|nr:related to regulatory protein cys-3 [Rhynchosporium commune]
MAYNGPSRVNMVEYISTLNHVPDQEMQPNPEYMEDDLAMFTNANFFDFDLGQDADLQPTDYTVDGGRDPAVAPDAVELKSLDFMNVHTPSDLCTLTGYHSHTSSSVMSRCNKLCSFKIRPIGRRRSTPSVFSFSRMVPYHVNNGHGSSTILIPTNPQTLMKAIPSRSRSYPTFQIPRVSAVAAEKDGLFIDRRSRSNYANDATMVGDYSFPDFNSFPPTTFTDTTIPPVPINTNTALYGSPNDGLPSQSADASLAGTKRKAESISLAGSPSGNDEDSARNAAEEDKRRRNTAASARFRVKKKQREQALERSAKDMSDKVSALEGRINQLETENKWLKNLITERNESKEDIAGLWKKYSAENAERKASERKDGVGTKA